MRRWRGVYATEAEAEALIAEAGDLATLFAFGMEEAGIREVSDPEIGDIGVVRIDEHQAGGIFTGRRWAFVGTVRGLAIASVHPSLVVRTWRP